MTETRIQSIIDARNYREQLAARRPERDPAVLAWRLFQRCVLMVMLAASFLICYSISVEAEILSLPELRVSVPAKNFDVHRPARRTVR